MDKLIVYDFYTNVKVQLYTTNQPRNNKQLNINNIKISRNLLYYYVGVEFSASGIS